MAALIGELDWSATRLGPRAGWPQSLRSALSLCLNLPLPACLWWGPALTVLYNDAWGAASGDKHPWALGRPAQDVWPEMWHQLGPHLSKALEFGEAVRLNPVLLPMPRSGFAAGRRFEFAVSPVAGEGEKTGGVLVTMVEVGGRPPRLWRTLAERGVAAAAVIGRAVRGVASRARQEGPLLEEGRRAIVDWALNKVHEAVYLINRHARFVYVNDEAVRALGYSREELLGMGVPDIDPDFPVERWRVMWEAMEAAESEGTEIHGPKPFETWHTSKEGRRFPVEITGSYVRYAGSSYVLSLAHDISDRKRAERQRLAHLRFLESMDRVNQAIQGASDSDRMMSDVLDVALDVFDCDRAFLLYPCDPEAPSWRVPMERTRPAFPGAFATGDVIPAGAENAGAMRAALDASGPIMLGPGGERPVPQTASAWFGVKSMIMMAIYPKVGAPWLFGLHQCSLMREWTAEERQLLEEIGRRVSDALTSLLAHRDVLQSEARLREAQRIAHLGDWEFNHASNVMTWSDEVFRILELEPGVSRPSREAFLEVVHPEDRERLTRCTESLECGEPCNSEFRLLMKDGRVKHLHGRWTVARDGDGKALRTMGTILDVTASKKVEEALFQAQKMEAIGQLTGGVAHDFNNLLTAITGNLDLLRMRLSDDAAVQKYARNALAAAERAAGITSQLLAFSRSQRLESCAINVDDVVAAMMGMLRQTVGEGVDLQQRCTPGLWAAMADRHQLETALLNLVINARDAMPGGGAVTIRAANVEFGEARNDLEYAQHSGKLGGSHEVLQTPPEISPGRYVALSVEDTGQGVAPDVAARIFEPFVTTKPVGKGTGLGLSMVYGFARQSGGAVGFQSAPGKGSIFTIYLPQTTGLAAKPCRSPDSSIQLSGSPGGGTILVVEDEAEVRKVAAMALKSFGYEVVEARDAAEALAILELRADILMVFSDIVMPRGSGAHLARLIRLRWPHLAILLATGYTGSLAKSELPSGVEVVMKPYRPAELGAKVRMLIEDCVERRSGPALQRPVF